MVGPGAGEGGQEAVVDVDDAVPVPADEHGREDLHVAGEDDELHPVSGEQFELGLFLFILGVAADREVMEVHPELFGHRPQVLVIADDQGDDHLQFARLPAGEQVVEAVRLAGDEDGQARHLAGEVQLPLHVVLLGDEGVEVFADLVVRDDEPVQLPLDAHEKDLLVLVHVLGEGGDVAVVLVDEFADRGDDALVVRAVDEQDGGGVGRVGGDGVHGRLGAAVGDRATAVRRGAGSDRRDRVVMIAASPRQRKPGSGIRTKTAAALSPPAAGRASARRAGPGPCRGRSAASGG